MKHIIRLLIVIFLFTGYPYKTLAAPINVKAVNAIAIDARSRVILYNKDGHKPVPMASTTKIITALIALNYDSLDEKFVISPKASQIRGSKVGYKAGEEITVLELVYGLMLRSGNDAAIALAEGISGSVDDFANLMNEYAKNMGILNTNFQSPHGLDSEYHFSSAYDLALATIKAKENPVFSKIVATKFISKAEGAFTRDYSNINKILWKEDATGVKTGYTGLAGKCLVSSFEKDDNEIIIVLLNSNQRFEETERLYKNIKENYEYKCLFSKNQVLKTLNTDSGKIKLGFKEDLILPIKKDSEVTKEVIVNSEVEIKGNFKKLNIGGIKIYQEDQLIFEAPLQIIK
ncbi:D-alanyl-D-alanine carboxypeptidase family protein [Alloiococcus sp. CFN-8]|uniref:D-alanyl-D-alanine carboxypeptidase family protein n=1 Tax=Alloiococcus sp. CFN-8 TaxID=3416081 RepID=UPI003CF26B2B